jgi:hypothetical protein
MEWKRGVVKFDDGSEYTAELLVSENGQIWNSRIHKDKEIIEETNADYFASKLGKSVEDVYPYTCELKE